MALDTTFALGWRKLASALTNARGSLTARDSALERAMRYSDRLPELERNVVRGAYYESHRTYGDRGKALAAYQAAYALDSLNKIAINQLLLNFTTRRQNDSAMRYARREVAVEPNVMNATRIASVDITLGRLDEAAGILDSILQATPEAGSSLALLQGRAALLVARDRRDSALLMAEQLRRAASIPTQLLGLTIQRNLSNTSGRLRQASAADDQRNALLAERGVPRIDGQNEAAANILFRGQPTSWAAIR